MRTLSTAPPLLSPAPRHGAAYVYGFIGVLVFSMTLPMSRIAVAELDPLLVGLGRALIAAVPAALLLWATGSRRPTRAEWSGLALAMLGIVVGWPLASTIAMRTVPSAHGAIFNGLLPLATAVFAAWRSGERPSGGFWACALVGAALVVGFALRAGHGALQPGDAWLLLAVVFGGMGYAEGARVARTLGGWRTICWALAASAPLLVVPVGALAMQVDTLPSTPVMLAVAYLSFGSMFLGFFAWYHGLALGGIARVGQVQLLQPFLTVVIAALLIDEAVDAATYGFALAVILVIALSRRCAIGGKR
jgi:drug/metabolite transporter (DMT)-like permease